MARQSNISKLNLSSASETIAALTDGDIKHQLLNLDLPHRVGQLLLRRLHDTFCQIQKTRKIPKKKKKLVQNLTIWMDLWDALCSCSSGVGK